MSGDERVFLTRVPNPIQDTSVPPRLPVNPTVVSHAIGAPRVGVAEVGVPYVEPVDVAPQPLHRRPVIETILDTHRYVTIASAPPLDEPVFARPWVSELPDERVHNVRVPNAVEDTSVPSKLAVNPTAVSRAMSAPRVGVAEVGVPYVEPVDVAPPPMARMPVVESITGAPRRVRFEEPMLMTMTLPGESEVTMNGVFPCITYGGINPIYAPFGAISGLSSQIANLSNEISNISGEIVVINSNIATLSSELTNLSGYVYANPVSNWSTYPAVSTLNMNNNSITNISSLQIDAQILTADASDLFLNGIAVATVTDISDIADWSLFPAISDVQMNTHNIVSEISGQGQFGIASWNTLELIGGLSGGTTTISGFLPVPLKGDVFIQSGKNKDGEITLQSGLLGNSNVKVRGYIDQTSVGGGTAISNYFDSAVQVGAGSGYLGVDGINQTAGSSALFVSGGTTLDGGGIVHGITIGTVPVAGINTQRIDVLPVGILLTTPTFITMNGLGAANIAMGGAIAIAAGSYVTLEHAAGLGANGIFVQNAARDCNAKMVFTGGGTIFNVNNVQTSNIEIASSIQFWNNRYNPSGGAVPIRPVANGVAIVDLSTSSSYFATLTGGNLPTTKNTDSVFIGTLTNLSTGGASGTIAIGDISGMSGQSDRAIAIGLGAGRNNQSSNAIAIGTRAGEIAQEDDCIAIGVFAGLCNQLPYAVAVGANAGILNQGDRSVAVGHYAGSSNQSVDSVAIGALAGEESLGVNSIAIGRRASRNGGLLSNTIMLNATGADMNPTQANSTFISPMRNIDGSGYQVLARSSGTGEIIQTLIDASSGFVESDWALYPAVTNVNISGFNITNVSEGTFQKLTLNSTEIALGLSAGITSQGLNSIAIGAGAGSSTQGNSAFALGNQAGNTNQGASCVAIGNFAGSTDQQTFSVAIGTNAGDTTQGTLAVAIGNSAGQVTQGENSVAIGADTAISSQGSNSVAIGYSVAGTSQGTGAVAIGSGTAGLSQGVKAIAIGFDAAYSNQASNAVAIGNGAGFQGQLTDAIAIGTFAANSNQSLHAVAIGGGAGASGQGQDSVAIGYGTANLTQGSNSVAVGLSAGQSNQLANAVAIGAVAGQSAQGSSTVAIGDHAGSISQSNNAIAIGPYAGYNTAGSNSISIGNSAGYSFTGRNSVMIGTSAVTANSNTIVLNATGGILDGVTANSTYIAPMRAVQNSNAYQNSLMTYNITTSEVGYATNAYSIQVVATSGTAIALDPTLRGKTFILTGTTTQAFSTTALGANDTGFFVVAHNGNGVNGGDINLTGMTGTNIVHERTNQRNNGTAYLYWNGTSLIGY